MSNHLDRPTNMTSLHQLTKGLHDISETSERVIDLPVAFKCTKVECQAFKMKERCTVPCCNDYCCLQV